jgi:hypothetical protein
MDSIHSADGMAPSNCNLQVDLVAPLQLGEPARKMGGMHEDVSSYQIVCILAIISPRRMFVVVVVVEGGGGGRGEGGGTERMLPRGVRKCFVVARRPFCNTDHCGSSSNNKECIIM